MPVLLLGLLLIQLFFPAIAAAQTPTKTQSDQTPTHGIAVTPSILRVDLDGDAPEAELVYTNNTTAPIELSISSQDFSDFEEGWRIKFLDDADAKNYRYGLSSWLTFSTSSLRLNPGESKTIGIFIDKNRLIPGGHYATIQAEMKQLANKGNVNLRGILSSLLFVRTATGKEIEEASISTFEPNRSLLAYPESYIIRLKNTGNVDLTPYGLIEVTDPLGRNIARGYLNESSLVTLPESLRRYDLRVNQKNHFLLPGMYTAKATLHYGKTNKSLTQTVTFFSQGSINLTLLITIGTFILLGGWYLRKRKKIQNTQKTQ